MGLISSLQRMVENHLTWLLRKSLYSGDASDNENLIIVVLSNLHCKMFLGQCYDFTLTSHQKVKYILQWNKRFEMAIIEDKK